MNARTLAVFRLYQLFNGILFSGPIWAVFLLSRGLSLTQFGIVEAVLHVGMLPRPGTDGRAGRRAGTAAAARRGRVLLGGGRARVRVRARVRADLPGGGHPRHRVRASHRRRRGVPVRLARPRRCPGPVPAHAGRPLGGVPVRRRDLVHGRRPDRDLLAAARVLADGGVRARGERDRDPPARRRPRRGPPRRARGGERPAGAAALAPPGDADAGVEPVLGGRHELVVLRRAAVPVPRRVGRAPRRRAGRRPAGRRGLLVAGRPDRRAGAADAVGGGGVARRGGGARGRRRRCPAWPRP